MINAQKVGFTVGNMMIVAPVDLEIAEANFTVLLGPNGAGKSTLIKLLSGDIDDGQGRVFYGGQDILKLNLKKLASMRVVLPQHSNLSFNFTTREVVEIGNIHGNNDELVSQAIEDVGLTELEHLHYTLLSGGQKQRCHLARVLVQARANLLEGFSPIIFLDEPTSSLDMAHQHWVMKIGHMLSRQGLCVVAVLHDLNLAASYADRVIMMKKGKIIYDGKPKQTFTDQNVTEIYNHKIEIIERGIRVLIDSPPLINNEV